MRFVRQLQTVGVGSLRLQFAKRDFYRASAQRSRWVRQSLLFDGEVGRFERRLIEEWQPRFRRCATGSPPTARRRHFGRRGNNFMAGLERRPLSNQDADRALPHRRFLPHPRRGSSRRLASRFRNASRGRTSGVRGCLRRVGIFSWADRPPEEARNLNPAFCAELVARTVGEFTGAGSAPRVSRSRFLSCR